jgi:hypothetical protein
VIVHQSGMIAVGTPVMPVFGKRDDSDRPDFVSRRWLHRLPSWDHPDYHKRPPDAPMQIKPTSRGSAAISPVPKTSRASPTRRSLNSSPCTHQAATAAIEPWPRGSLEVRTRRGGIPLCDSHFYIRVSGVVWLNKPIAVSHGVKMSLLPHTSPQMMVPERLWKGESSVSTCTPHDPPA